MRIFSALGYWIERDLSSFSLLFRVRGASYVSFIGSHAKLPLDLVKSLLYKLWSIRYEAVVK